MTAYKDRILEVIGEEEMGLTTVDVAKKAGVSKTTVIKYLSVLSSEGQVEFVEVGPSKLWRKRSTTMKREGDTTVPLAVHDEPSLEMTLAVGNINQLIFSFRINPDRVCEIMKRSGKCLSNDD